MASKANLKTSGREAALARRRALSTGGKPRASSAAAERSRSAPVRPPVSSGNASRPAPQARQRPEPSPSRSSDARQPATSRSFAASGSRRRPPVGQPSAARARREALSRQGRRAAKSQDRVRSPESVRMSASATAAPKAATASAAVEAARSPASANAGSQVKTTSRLTAPSLGSNRSGTNSLGQSRARSESASGKSVRSRRRDHGLGAKPTGRMLSQARRAAQSGRGKAATNAPTSAAGLARQANPKLSGRELSQRVRAQRSHNGGAGEPKSAPTGRLRPNAAARGAADQHWKVGVSETAAGQTVTGTRVGRSPKTTGDESSTCRAVTGTEYMGADIFREFCHTEPRRGVLKVGVSPSGQGNSITGNEVGRSTRVTGDEPGSCTRVTGTDYLSPAHFEAFCETTPEPNHGRRTGLAATQGGQPVSGSQVGRSTRVTGDEQGAGVQTTGTQYTNVQSITDGIPPHQSGNRPAAQVPKKVGVSSTLSGRQVTGTRVGRAAQVTGDEPGSCRSVTGDEYLSSEQYESFCATRPEPEPARAGEESRTALGQRVSGTQTGRSTRVTGDEPGTCKAVTGTPYAGMEQMAEYCSPAARESARERMMPMARRSAGAAMTGQAPGVGGKISGDERGVCEPLTGTPYVSPAQQSAVCAENESFQADQSGLAATPDEADFPQPLSGASWPSFSVTSPARQADHQRAVRASAVTGGLDSKNGGRITGPFGMATGKITGTEEARFGAGRKSAPASASAPAGEPAPSGGRQVTGEGLSAGLRITGDDWARGERVTGTEGAWSKQRNPTRSGPTSAMPSFERKRNEETPLPVSRVTGSSGNTERGSLITYSGGARG